MRSSESATSQVAHVAAAGDPAAQPSHGVVNWANPDGPMGANGAGTQWAHKRVQVIDLSLAPRVHHSIYMCAGDGHNSATTVSRSIADAILETAHVLAPEEPCLHAPRTARPTTETTRRSCRAQSPDARRRSSPEAFAMTQESGH